MSSQILLPGQSLGTASSAKAGDATHIQDGNLHSSISGPLLTTPTTKSSKSQQLSVLRTTGPLLPTVQTTVLGTIIRTNPRQANISIHALGSNGFHPLRSPLPGIIRQQDIRSTEIDKVRVAESFRVGDVVRATVISLGDERSYYLGTARDDLGVVMARAEGTGNVMVPVSWREFLDEETGAREGRKVAKPV